MKKLVAFAVAACVAAGSTVAMAQCQSCQQSQVFSQPVYSAPVVSAPVYAQPVYSAPVESPIVYGAPVVESAPAISYQSAPVASSGCGCSGGMSCSGGVSYGGQQTLTVGAVINGETVVSVGESVVTGTSEVPAGEAMGMEGSGSKNTIEGAVEPTSDGGEVVSPPSEGEGEVTPPAPDEA